MSRAGHEAKETRISRREVLRLSLLTLAGMLYAGCSARRIFADRQVVKLLLITDVHAGTIDILRPSNRLETNMLKAVLKLMPKNYFDRAIQLGDMVVNTGTEQKDIENLRANLSAFKELSCPQKHLVGNHDIRQITEDNLKKTFREFGLQDQFYGIEEFANFQAVWLDQITENGVNGFLPEERIDWLIRNINPVMPTVIFSHQSLVPPDVSENYLFRDRPQDSYLVNGPEVWAAIRHLPILAVVSGHTHLPSVIPADLTQMISLPAFSEHLGINPQNPGVYSIFQTDGIKFFLSSYSGAASVFKTEGSI